MTREKRSGLKHVELQEDLQQVERQEQPFWVSYQRIVLVQTNEDGVHQDDQVIYNHKSPKRVLFLHYLQLLKELQLQATLT